MLYKIKNEYYILVGRKYVKVSFEINKDDINIKPNVNDYIEKTDDLIVSEQPFDSKFKKSIIDKNKKPLNEEKDTEIRTRKNRYSR